MSTSPGKVVYVIGYNEDYNFGLNHKNNVKKLTNWNCKYSNIIVDNIHCSYRSTIFSNKDGYYWIAGELHFDGEYDYFEENIGCVKQCKQIEYFQKNNIFINRICTNNITRCSSMFWISNRLKLYGNGKNNTGQLGLDDDIDRYNPELVNYLDNVFDACPGSGYSLILCHDNNNNLNNNINIIIIYWCKSYGMDEISNDIIKLITMFAKISQVYSTLSSGSCGNGHGQIPDDSMCGQKTWKFKKIEALSNKDIIQIGSGCNHSLFLQSNGILWGCGYNIYGQLGLKDIETEQYIPIEIIFFKMNNIKIKTFQCGGDYTLAIDYNGRLYSFGWNEFGECGHGDTMINKSIIKPKLIEFLKQYKIINIQCSISHSYAMSNNNKHFLFGSNAYNECTILHNENDKITVPFYINNTIKQLTDGTIKHIYLGRMNTKIMVSHP